MKVLLLCPPVMASRMVHFLYRDVVAKEAPAEVASLNWIFFRETDDFERAFASLVQTIDTDLEWVKAHTRLTIRAVEWDRRGRNSSYLLQGDDLAEAEQRLAQQAQKEPKLSDLQRTYILTSRQQATRRQRLMIGAITLGMVVSVVLALIAFMNFLNAEEQSQIARNAEATAVAEREIAWNAQGTAEASEQLAWHAVATAEAERNRAATAEANAYILRDKAEAERAEANSRELASAAIRNLAVDPELSILLALQGVSVARTMEAEDALRQALLNSRLEQTSYDTIPLLDLDELQALAQSRLTRQLRPEECEKYLRLNMCP